MCHRFSAHHTHTHTLLHAVNVFISNWKSMMHTPFILMHIAPHEHRGARFEGVKMWHKRRSCGKDFCPSNTHIHTLHEEDVFILWFYIEFGCFCYSTMHFYVNAEMINHQQFHCTSQDPPNNYYCKCCCKMNVCSLGFTAPTIFRMQVSYVNLPQTLNRIHNFVVRRGMKRRKQSIKERAESHTHDLIFG